MINIRNAKIDDWEIIADYMEIIQNIHAQYYPNIFKRNVRRDKAYFENVLNNNNKRIFVAEKTNRIVGYIKGKLVHFEDCEVKFQRQYGYMDSIYVIPEARGELIDQKLFAALFEWFKQHGIHEAEGAVWEFNKDARLVFEMMGSVTYQRKQIIHF